MTAYALTECKKVTGHWLHIAEIMTIACFIILLKLSQGLSLKTATNENYYQIIMACLEVMCLHYNRFI